MTDPRLVVLLGVLGLVGVILGAIVACLGVLMPWAYPRNVLGIRSAFGKRLGWLPGVCGSLLVETAVATLLVLGLAAAMLSGSLALVPTT
jgi:hypothetical protein